MSKLFAYLSERRFINLSIVLAYYLLVVLPHEQVGVWVQNHIARPLGRKNYNLIVLILACSAIIFILRALYYKSKELSPKNRRVVMGFFVFSIVLLLISLNTIVVINVELIHLLQYAIMSILLFPLFLNYRETLFYSSLLGAIDELYQYLILTPEKNDYYDFNDVILNMLGACMALVLIRSHSIKEKHKSFFSSSASWLMIVISLLIAALYFSGYIAFYPSDLAGEKVIFWFVKIYEEGFWHTIPVADPFHIVRPLEGIIIISILFNIFKQVGKDFDIQSVE